MRYWFGILAFLCCCNGLDAQESQKDILIVGYTQAPPFIIEEDNTLTGINVWLWERVAEDLDLAYKLVPLPFSEMLEGLESGKIDVSINPLTVTSDRSKVIDFTYSFYSSHSTVAVSSSSSWERLKNFLGSFFNLNVLRGFVVFFALLFFFGALIWLFERRKNKHFRSGGKGIWDGLWWSVVTITTVGYGDKAPNTFWGKLAALGLMLTGLLFVSGLTASIASSLTVNQLTNTSKDLDFFKDKKVGTIVSSSSGDFLKTRFFKDVSLYSNVAEGLMELKDGTIEAIMYDEPILRYRIKKDSLFGDLELLPISFDVQFYAFGLSKQNVILEKQISQQMLEIIETMEWQIVLSEYGLSEL